MSLFKQKNESVYQYLMAPFCWRSESSLDIDSKFCLAFQYNLKLKKTKTVTVRGMRLLRFSAA